MKNNTNSFVRNDWVDGLGGVLILYIAYHHFASRYMDYYPEVDFSYVSEVGGIIGNFDKWLFLI